MLLQAENRRFRVALALLVNAGGLLLLLYLLPAREDLLITLHTLSAPHMGLALLLVITSWLCDATRLHRLAHCFEQRLPWPTAFRAVLVGNFMINETPFYLGAGLVHTVELHRQGASWWLATATVTAGALIANGVQLALAWMALLIGWSSFKPVITHMPVVYAAVFLYTAAFMVLLTAFTLVKDLAERLKAHITRRYVGVLARVGVELCIRLETIAKSPR